MRGIKEIYSSGVEWDRVLRVRVVVLESVDGSDGDHFAGAGRAALVIS
jgi:hypothetical protein